MLLLVEIKSKLLVNESICYFVNIFVDIPFVEILFSIFTARFSTFAKL